MERIIGGKYKVVRKIGGGSFGDIFLATHVDTFEIVAVKIENSKTKHPQLLYEAKLYRILEGGSGSPCIRWFGVDGTENALVMDLFGRKCIRWSRRFIRVLWEEILTKDSLALG